jgi:hypothetical protein
MKASRIFTTIIILLGIFLRAPARAADAPSANPYSGDIWTRSTLSGDWWGFRNQLTDKGITLDMSLTQSAQGIVHGGKNTGWQYGGGRGDIILNLDTQKLGLWPGGFLNVEAEGNFIPEDNLFKSINGRTGALMSVYSSQLFPTPSGDNFNLPALNFTQFLSPYFGLTIGKYATVTRRRHERVRPRQGRYSIHEYGTQCQSDPADDRPLFNARHRVDCFTNQGSAVGDRQFPRGFHHWEGQHQRFRRSQR